MSLIIASYPGRKCIHHRILNAESSDVANHNSFQLRQNLVYIREQIANVITITLKMLLLNIYSPCLPVLMGNGISHIFICFVFICPVGIIILSKHTCNNKTHICYFKSEVHINKIDKIGVDRQIYFVKQIYTNK